MKKVIKASAVKPWNMKYRDCTIRLNNKLGCYDIYDSEGELYDSGFKVVDDAVRYIDKHINEINVSDKSSNMKPWNTEYKNCTIRLNNKLNCYDIYDSKGELYDYGFKSVNDAVRCIDEHLDEINSSVNLNTVESAEDTDVDESIKNSMDAIKEDFDYIISGLEKLARSGASSSQAASIIIENIQSDFQNHINDIADQVSEA